MIRNNIIFFVISIFFWNCSIGINLKRDKIEKFEIGKSKKDEIVKYFGEPKKKINNLDNNQPILFLEYEDSGLKFSLIGCLNPFGIAFKPSINKVRFEFLNNVLFSYIFIDSTEKNKESIYLLNPNDLLMKNLTKDDIIERFGYPFIFSNVYEKLKKNNKFYRLMWYIGFPNKNISKRKVYIFVLDKMDKVIDILIQNNEYIKDYLNEK